MGSYSAVAYGLALTEEFGDQLEHIPDRLFDYAQAMRTWSETQYVNREYLDSDALEAMEALGIEALPEETRQSLFSVGTADGDAMVLGFGVREQDLDQPDIVGGYRARWDALVQGFPPEIQADLQQSAAIARPQIHILTGRD